MIPEVVKYRGVGKVFYIPKARPYSVLGLCLHLKISRPTWTNYRRKLGYSDVCERVERGIYVHKFDHCVVGIFNAGILGREIRPGGYSG